MLRCQNDSRTVSIHPFTRQVAIETVETGEVSLPNALDLPDIESYVRYVTDHVAVENVYDNITQRCNLACPYCYAALNRSVVSMSDHYTILTRLEALGFRSVTAIGGEPLSHPKFSELLASITECDFVEEVCIVTNGTMIHKRHLEVLSHPKVYLQISVDGHDEATNSPTRGRGSFARAMRAVALAKEAGIPFRVMQVLTRSTADTATEFYDHFAAIGCSPGFFMVKQVADTERPTTEQLRRLLDHVFTKTGDVHSVLDAVKFADNMQFETTGYPVAHCGAGISAICVDTDGSVYPCVKRTDRADRICNLLDADAIATLSAHAQRLIRKELVFSKPVCQDCRLAALCGGGCRAEEDSNGDPCQAGCDYFALAVAFYAEHVSSAPSR